MSPNTDKRALPEGALVEPGDGGSVSAMLIAGKLHLMVTGRAGYGGGVVLAPEEAGRLAMCLLALAGATP